jgi:hypothetical protein
VKLKPYLKNKFPSTNGSPLTSTFVVSRFRPVP